MASIDVGGAKGKKRALDSEINMIPMIDLLMVTISFLLITAVWVQAKLLEADAVVPGQTHESPPCGAECKEEARLHVETADPSKFVLAWKTGRTVIRSVDVPRENRQKTGLALPNLAARIEHEWSSAGAHREPSDRHFDRAVVHAANDMAYSELVAVMDAVAQPKRRVTAGGKTLEAAAFDVTLATD